MNASTVNDNGGLPAWRAQVRRFCEAHVAPNADAWERKGRIPAAAFAAAGRDGILSLDLEDGLGHCWRRQRILVEELVDVGSLGIAMAFTAHHASLVILREGAPGPTRADAIARLRGGRERISLVITEPQAGSDLSTLCTTAVPVDGGYRLSGQKTLICGGLTSGLFLTLADVKRDERPMPTLFLVPRGDAIHASPLTAMGWRSMDLASLAFRDMFVPSDARASDEGQGFPLLVRGLYVERLNLALLAAASSRKVVAVAHGYARSRLVKQQPLAKHPLIQQRLAEMYSKLRCTDSVIRDALERFGQGATTPVEVLVAKNVASEMANQIVDAALQLTGGAGCLEQGPIERAYRDCRLLAIGGGTTEVLNQQIFLELDRVYSTTKEATNA